MDILLTLFFWFRYLIWISAIVIAIFYLFGFRKLWLIPYFGLAIVLLFEDTFHFIVASTQSGFSEAIRSMLFWELPIKILPKEYVLKQVQFSKDLNTVLAIVVAVFLAFYFGAKYIRNKNLFFSKIGFLLIILSFVFSFIFQNIVGGGTRELNGALEFSTKIHSYLYHITFPISYWLAILGSIFIFTYLVFKKLGPMGRS